MDNLPLHLVEKILFRLDPKSLAMMQCTNGCIKSYISDPNFKTEYLSRLGSGLVDISRYGSTTFFCHSSGDSRSNNNRYNPLNVHSQVLGSCSGLLLLCIDGLCCVANPITESFRFLRRPKSMPIPTKPEGVNIEETNRIGFAVDQIDRTTQIFRIVCLINIATGRHGSTMYKFHINNGDSWRVSKSTLTCSSINLEKYMKPVYLNGSLHWLREDGVIIAFDSTKDRSRFIPSKSPENLSSRKLFTAVKNELALISATKEVIYVYSLENIRTDPTWILVRRIENIEVMTERRFQVAAYDGESLVVTEGYVDKMVHRYDLRANKWGVMGSTVGGHCDHTRDYYQFKPSLCTVIGPDDDRKEMAPHDKRLHSLSKIMSMVAEISLHAYNLVNKKTKLGKRLRLIDEEEETRLKSCQMKKRK